ncbi:ankyrin repeat protein [Thraustotheca clavata]|uniref:Ankyrin repeat protein n=1 Tax=Thraustotheca clavata TaxID=74557 RepID=A0A1V9ZZN1_9STRA|nr:ankyrin repeat protein [Thraustotheca clavata]
MATRSRLNVNANEFVPASQQAFRSEFPSLSSDKMKLPTSTKVLNFAKVKSTPIPAAITETPSLPEGFDVLRPKKKALENENDQETLAEAIEIDLVVTEEKSKRTKISKQKKWRELKAVKAVKETRMPGYFIEIAARSKALGETTEKYEESYTCTEWQPPRASIPMIPQTIATLPVGHATEIRSEWLAKAWPILAKNELDRDDLDWFQYFLSSHRSLLLWDERDEDKCNAWHLAAMNNHTKILDCMWTLGSKEAIDSRDRKKQTPLHIAAQYGQVAAIKLLLQYSSDTHAIDKRGNTPLHLACRSNSFAAVKVLLSPSKLEARNRSRETPLLSAIAATKQGAKEQFEIIALLLNSGASVSVFDHSFQSPLYIGMPFPALIERLVVYGYPSNPSLLSPLHLAAKHGYKESLSVVLTLAPPFAINQVEKSYGDSILHTAVRYNQVEIVAILVQFKKLLSMENTAHETPLFLAIRLDKPECIELLLLNGGYPNERDRHQRSALLFAMELERYNCIQVLMNFECTVDAGCVEFVKATHYKQHAHRGSGRLFASYTMVHEAILTDAQLKTLQSNHTIAVHRSILCSRSPVLRTLWAGSWSEQNTPTFKLDCSDTTLELLVTLFYHPNVSTLLNASAEVVYELLYIANELIFKSLEVLCVWTLVHLHNYDMVDIWDESLGNLISSIGDKTIRDITEFEMQEYAKDLKTLLQEKWLADMKLISSDGTEFPCHKAILLSQCRTLNQTNSLSNETISSILEYLYTKQWPLSEGYTMESIMLLLECSVDMQVWDLTEHCESELMLMLNDINAENLYHFAIMYSSSIPNLMTACRIVLLESIVGSPQARKELKKNHE